MSIYNFLLGPINPLKTRPVFYLNYSSPWVRIGPSLTIDVIGAFRCALKLSFWHANGHNFLKLTTSSATRDENVAKMTYWLLWTLMSHPFPNTGNDKHILRYNALQKSTTSGGKCVLQITSLDLSFVLIYGSPVIYPHRVSDVGLLRFLCCLPEQVVER